MVERCYFKFHNELDGRERAKIQAFCTGLCLYVFILLFMLSVSQSVSQSVVHSFNYSFIHHECFQLFKLITWHYYDILSRQPLKFNLALGLYAFV